MARLISASPSLNCNFPRGQTLSSVEIPGATLIFFLLHRSSNGCHLSIGQVPSSTVHPGLYWSNEITNETS